MKKIVFSLLFICYFFLIVGCQKENKQVFDNLVNLPININQNEPLFPSSNDKVTQYSLGYGDYVYTTKKMNMSQLKKRYQALSTIVKGKVNGIYQTSYEQGLLDIFNFENEVKLKINLSFDELKQLDLYHQIKNEESYRRCSVDIAFSDIIIHYENVGIKQKGNTSRGNIINQDGTLMLRHYKLHFAKTFDDEFMSDTVTFSADELAYLKERSLFGLNKLDIRYNRNQDATYLKEAYAYEIYRAAGILSPRTNLANVIMNIDGSLHNAGVYLMVETVNKSFLKRNLLKEYIGGDLYKLGWSNEGASFTRNDYSLFGCETQVAKSDGTFYTIKYPYELKTNKKTSNHHDLYGLIDQLTKCSSSNIDVIMKEYSYYQDYIKYLAVSYLLGDPDDLRGNHNNTYLYFVPQKNGNNKMILIPTDHDRAFGSTGGAGGNPTGDFCTDNGPFSPQTGYIKTNNPLFNKTIINSGDGVSFGNDVIKTDYIKQIEQIINDGWMNIDTFKLYYDAATIHYQNDLVLDKLFSNPNVLFSLEENNVPSGDWNLSIAVYLQQKVATFNRKKFG